MLLRLPSRQRQRQRLGEVRLYLVDLFAGLIGTAFAVAVLLALAT